MKRLPPALAMAAAATPAAAHVDPLAHGSFAAGFTHPLLGPDHLLAMVAVGLWAVTPGGRALAALPAGFVAAMVAGFALALGGVPLPWVEPMILASVLLSGALVAGAVRLPLAPAMAAVGLMGLFHGHAHGAEMGDAAPLAFLCGFALATAALHAAGVALARVGAARILGAGVALAGSVLLLAG